MNTYYNFIRPLVSKILLLFFLLGLCAPLGAQEFLTGLRTNPQIIKENQQHREIFKQKSTAEHAPLLLPFFEDFSNYTGYPNEKLFMDKQAFVNHTFPVFPPTIGVVTLDALNEHGELYPHLTTTPRGADTLTSRYIRLDSLFLADTIRRITPADSIYFSFYFQPGGGGVAGAGVEATIGNQPEHNDLLILEFGYTVLEDTVYVTYWDQVWFSHGFNIDEWLAENPLEYFRQVLIPITDPKYLCDNFQFRFRNFASLEPQQGIAGWEGNVDQWHIDYIRLDVNRNSNDIFTNDLAFVSPTTSFLNNYQAMPWKQFQPSNMKSNFTNQLTNLSDAARTSIYQYNITQHGNVVYEYNILMHAFQIMHYFEKGIQSQPDQAFPAIGFTPVLKDTTVFTITHIFRIAEAEDFALANDTCVFEQKFYDYYAYDDGTAEYGYCINNQFNVAYLAMKFSLKEPDDLSAVRMWFNQTRNSANENALFSIFVWKDNNGVPGDTLYTLEGNRPGFEEDFLDFVEYPFNKKVPVSGTFWVGFQQHGNVQLNIGFDQNTDSREFFRFNTRGIWEESVFKGTPMLRPVFGEITSSPNCCEPSPVPAMLKPNPANDWIEIINVKSRITNIEIYDMMGRKQKAEGRTENSGIKINISQLPTGIYFVRIHKENNTFETLKLIKN
ncbi:MAG: T9SS type A sorting domain-containing protein [Lentimicrobiaceae bacterium]|nr:T9SS type A sorting domain-containing protein [Lentimicrobiaceae bacterium]